MIDVMLSATGWALIEAGAVRTAVALFDGADDLAVRGGERRRALQVLWGRGGDIPWSDTAGGLPWTSPGCIRR
jgi:hypothetical protein